MPASLLNDALENFFTEHYRIQTAKDSVQKSASRFAFEQFPLGLASDDFFAKKGDASTFSRAAVDEYLSTSIADSASSLEDDYRQALLGSVSDTYFYELLGPSNFWKDAAAADEQNIESLNWYTTVVAEAKRRFARHQVVSTSGMAVSHSATTSLPPNWLDPEANGNWIQHQLEIKPKSAVKNDMSNAGTSSTAAQSEAMSVPLITMRKLNSVATDLDVKKFDTQAVIFANAQLKMHAQNSTTEIQQPISKITPSLELHSLDLLKSIQIKHPINTLNLTGKTNLVNRNDLLWRAIDQATQPAKPVALPGIKLEFSFQIVQIRRPWVFTPFLFNSNWFVKGQKRGALSHASSDDETERFSWLPSAIVLVKDVNIRANWAHLDPEDIQQAFSVGPFAVGDKKMMSSESLQIPGIQWIASINQAMPVLPPRDDPALVVS